MSRLEDGNLLEPMVIAEWWKAQVFIRDHRCGLCGSKHLAIMPIVENYRTVGYHIRCWIHGDLTEMQTVKTRAAEQAEASQQEGQRMMNEGRYSKQTAAEILKSLGFD